MQLKYFFKVFYTTLSVGLHTCSKIRHFQCNLVLLLQDTHFWLHGRRCKGSRQLTATKDHLLRKGIRLLVGYTLHISLQHVSSSEINEYDKITHTKWIIHALRKMQRVQIQLNPIHDFYARVRAFGVFVNCNYNLLQLHTCTYVVTIIIV